jgi:K+-sensing histidine kinase KdpD
MRPIAAFGAADGPRGSLWGGAGRRLFPWVFCATRGQAYYAGTMMKVNRYRKAAELLVPLVSFAALFLLGEALVPLVGVRSVDLLFLAAVLGLSLVAGPVPVAILAVLSTLALNYLSLEPVHSLAIVAREDWALFFVYFLVALSTGFLVSRLRSREEMLAQREEEKRKVLVQLESERLGSILLDSVSHELRTPLTAITGSLSALSDETLAAKAEARREIVANALGAAEELERIVDDLLSLSRIESGALRLSRRAVESAELAQAAASRAGPELAGRELRIATREGEREAFVDFALAARLAANLLRNAAKYSPPERPIDFSLSAGEEALEIRVRDWGSGLPEDELGSIFAKFRPAREAARGQAGGGLGLGLAICKGIALAHGGSIEAHNASGGGLELVALLPYGRGSRL